MSIKSSYKHHFTKLNNLPHLTSPFNCKLFGRKDQLPGKPERALFSSEKMQFISYLYKNADKQTDIQREVNRKTDKKKQWNF